MSKEAVVKVQSGIVDDPHQKAGHRGFQSKEAMNQASVARQAPSEEGAEAQSAEVADLTDAAPRPISQEIIDEDLKMVKVRSREYIAPFTYGKKVYTLPAGKDVLVPRAVKRHLEEKNKL